LKFRWNQDDPCKGPIQITRAYKKWAVAYANNPLREEDYSTRVVFKMDNIRNKILKKLDC